MGQFIFMSSAIVYGDSAPLGQRRMIDRGTRCSPTNCYGDSKVQAGLALKGLRMSASASSFSARR